MSDNQPMNLYPSILPNMRLRQSPTVGCLCGCGKFAHNRGLCEPCYHKSMKQVKAGETTWAKLESEGKARPSTSRRAGRSGAVGE